MGPGTHTPGQLLVSIAYYKAADLVYFRHVIFLVQLFAAEDTGTEYHFLQY